MDNELKQAHEYLDQLLVDRAQFKGAPYTLRERINLLVDRYENRREVKIETWSDVKFDAEWKA